MYELAKEDYDKIKHLVDREISSNAFLAVIDGYSPGKIFVDDKNNPLTSLVWSKGIAGFGVIGHILSDSFTKNFVPFVDEFIIPFLLKQSHTQFEVNCICETLNNSFAELISTKHPHQFEQNLYKFDSCNMENSSNEVRKKVYAVNKELLSSSVNVDLIKDTVNQYWYSIDEFLSSGIGYCCIENNIAVSLSYSSFISNSYYEIGIETLSDYRRNGFAYSAACAVLDEILLRGKTPFWECSAKNVASANTAEKLGFRKKLVYLCYCFNI